jgi:hypothetical protein
MGHTHVVEFRKRCKIGVNGYGGVLLGITLRDERGDEQGFDDLLLDTGAAMSLLNKEFADENGYRRIEGSDRVVFGFNDYERARKALAARHGKSAGEIKSYFDGYRRGGRGKDLKDDLLATYGVSDVGIAVELRRVPAVKLCGFIVKDAVIATPKDDGVDLPNVIGMNILEKFTICLDLNGRWLYMGKRDGKPLVGEELRCGEVAVDAFGA